MSTTYETVRHHDNRQYYEIPPGQERYSRDRDEVERPRKLIRYAVPPPALLSSRGPPSPRGPPPPQASFARYTQSSGSRPDYREQVPGYSVAHATAKDRPTATSTLLRKDGYEYKSHASPAHITHTRPGLECTVCGPGAQGPWRRGPLGPYSLCQACSQIQWKAGDAEPALPTYHEALSLLDNMRLIRIVTLERRANDSSVAALIRRLQQGLPDNTYGRAEEYFSKRSENARKTEELKAEQRKLDMVQAAKRKREEAEYRYEQEKRRTSAETTTRTLSQLHIRPTRNADGTVIIHRPPQHQRTVSSDAARAPAPAPAPVPGPASTSAISPSTMEAAAALVQQRPPSEPDTVKQVSPKPLERTGSTTNSNAVVQATSEEVKKGAEVVTVTSGTSETLSSISSAASGDLKTSSRTRRFPLREPPSSSPSSKERIIDRRRARNELLRKRYLAHKAQKAKEAAAAAAQSDVPAPTGQKTASSSTPGSAPVPPPTAAVQMTVGRAVTTEPRFKKQFISENRPKPQTRRGSA